MTRRDENTGTEVATPKQRATDRCPEVGIVGQRGPQSLSCGRGETEALRGVAQFRVLA